jgi:hypothetical protein
MRRFIAILCGACLAAAWLAAACGDASVPSPFVGFDAGEDAADSGGAGGAGGADAAADQDADPTLGGPCVDDGQCDDGVDCTFDACDLELSRCRFVPDDSKCADDVYCNGIERCTPGLGCRPGDAVTCSDDTTCTIDTCIESTRTCEHMGRDADGDGDSVWNCPGGGDCDDSNPRISSLHPEICGNGRDDDCDGEIDEADCEKPANDTCLDPLEITTPGRYLLDLAAAGSDYSASCGGSGGGWRDGVLAIIVPQGAAKDVDIVAFAGSGSLSLASVGQCGDASSETACVSGASANTGGVQAWLLLRGAAAGAHAVYVFATGSGPVTLDVAFREPEPKPDNETCGTAASILPGQHVSVPIIDATRDLTSPCFGAMGELVYAFELSEPRDVHAYAVSVDGRGSPILSLRQGECSTADDELTCRVGPAVEVFARALPAGTYYLAVSATAATVLDVVVEASPPSVAPADDRCQGAPAIAHNTTIDVSLEGHEDAAHLSCLVGAPDAAYTLDLTQRSDVLVVERIYQGTSGAVSLAREPCASVSDRIVCATSTLSPVRAAAHDVAPGSYRAVVESSTGTPVSLTALVRPARAPILVAFADGCDDAVDVPPGGGFFQGNTANASADYEAGCDLGGQAAGGAPDQMLRLTLDRTRRVVLDMKGSAYSTLLDVRRGPSCPGTEVVQGCAAGYYADRSFLDLVLAAGEYYLQIDGYAGASGEWFLDVFVVDP